MTEAVRSQDPILLLTGDSGVGKSALLKAVIEEARTQGYIAPDVTPLQHRPGALQEALLAQLANATAMLISETPAARRAGQLIVAAAKRVAKDRGQQLAIAVGKELLSIAKARLGNDIGQALGEFVNALITEQEESLLARLRAAADPDALEALTAFAEEIEKLAKGSIVMLGIDDADRLSPPDVRQLADLAEMIPSGVRLRVGFLSVTPEDQEQILFLRRASINELPVTGLSVESIEEWILAEQLDIRLASRIYSITGGYPLFVDDALAILANNGTLVEVGRNEMFEQNTQEILRRLDLETARTARLLSAYADQPPPDRLLSLLDVDETTWFEMRDRLVRCRLFATVVAGKPWFHELRRRAIWNSLDSIERSTAADRAIANLEDEFDQSRSPSALVALTAIAKDSPRVQADTMSSYALAATTAEVIVAASILELAENPNIDTQPQISAVIGDSLLVYAQKVFGTSSDLLPALKKLADKDLITIAGNQSATVVIPRFNKLTAMILAGRSGGELGRLPIPRLASNIFRTVIAFRLGEFLNAQYGLGSPSIAQMAASIGLDPRSGTQFLLPTRRPPTLLSRGMIAGQPFYLSATFPRDDGRDQAAERIDGLVQSFMSERFCITDVVKIPTCRVPSRRFLRAVSLILKNPLARYFPEIRTNAPLEFSETVRRKAETFRWIRTLCSQVERYALELEQPVKLAFADGDRYSIVAEILGGEDGFIALAEFPSISMFGTDPYEAYSLRYEFGLSWNQSIGMVDVLAGPRRLKDPVVETLVALSKKAETFNSQQLRLQIPLNDAPALQQLLNEADKQLYNDAEALYPELTISVETNPPVKTTTLVAVCPDIQEDGWIEGAHALAGIMTLVSTETRSVQVYVAAASERPTHDQVQAAFREGFGIELSLGVSVVQGHRAFCTYGGAGSILSELASYRKEDTEFFRENTA